MIKKPTLIIAGLAAAGVIYYTALHNPVDIDPLTGQTVRKLQQVEPLGKQPLKNRSSWTAECTAETVASLVLKHNGELIWKKSHDEFFAMDKVITIDDRRLKGPDMLMPLAEITKQFENFKAAEFIVCDGANVNLHEDDITQTDDQYYIGLNNKGWIKLIRSDGKHYRTVAKAVTEINIKTRKK